LKLRTVLRIALLLILMDIAAVSAFRASVDGSLEELRVANTQRLELYANSLNSEIGHYARLPSLLGLSPYVEGLLHAPEDRQRQQAANDYLERLSQRTGASAIYIMDSKGIVRATSNWHQPDSYLGENDAFRAYFTDAMSGQPGRFFGVGTTRSEAGYYLSEPLSSHGRIIGVAVVKVNMEYLEKLWRENKTTVMVSDQNGVVILATEPGWKFSTLKPFSKALQDAFDRNLQYNRKRLLPLGLEERRSLGNGSHIYRLDQSGRRTLSRLAYPRDMLGQSLQLPLSSWKLTVLSSLDPVYQLAYNRAALAAVLTLLSLTGILWLNERRRRLRDKLSAREALQQAYRELERKVEERTADLSRANQQLQEEISERIRAEQHLRQTQDNLVQAGKLAVLGQLATGIAHELNQPLAACAPCRAMPSSFWSASKRNRPYQSANHLSAGGQDGRDYQCAEGLFAQINQQPGNGGYQPGHRQRPATAAQPAGNRRIRSCGHTPPSHGRPAATPIVSSRCWSTCWPMHWMSCKTGQTVALKSAAIAQPNNWYCKSAIMAPACRTPYAHSCSSPLSPPNPPASAWDWG
jgi:two-component system C4-dicarboxylate transport sensor histidine kinase DctB